MTTVQQQTHYYNLNRLAPERIAENRVPKKRHTENHESFNFGMHFLTSTVHRQRQTGKLKNWQNLATFFEAYFLHE